jgi:hypothetical protein
VQIFNADKTEVLATILAIPNYRLEPTGETVINFHERPGDSPEALRAWFYPGDNFGQEFVYPKKRAIQLAQASKEIVPAETIEPTESTLKTVPLVAITPEKKEEPVTEAIQVLPLHTPEQAAAAPPQTLKPDSLDRIARVRSHCFRIDLEAVGKAVFVEIRRPFVPRAGWRYSAPRRGKVTL